MDMQRLQALMSQQGAQAEQKPLLEFRAGILNVRGQMLHADARKGKVEINQGADGALKLTWKLRPGNETQFDLPLRQGAYVFERIPECTTGRVYVLRSTSSSGQKRFFWIQEPTEDKDTENCEKLNTLISTPPARPNNGLGGLLGNMTPQQQQLMQMLGGNSGGGAPGAPAQGGMSEEEQLAAAIAASREQHQADSALQNEVLTQPPQPMALDGPSNGGAAASATGASGLTPETLGNLTQLAQQFASSQRRQLNLSDVLNTDRVMPAVEEVDQKDQKAMELLFEQLPAELREGGLEEVRTTLRSPQLQHCLQRMGALCDGEHFGSLMQSLGLRADGNMGVRGFLEAVEQLVAEETAKEEEASNTNMDERS